MKITKYLESKSKPFILILALILVIIISLANYYFAPTGMATAIFYFIPIIIATWYGGDKIGIFICFAITLIWFILKGKSITRLDSAAFIDYWNASVRLGLFLTINYLLSELKNALEREQKMARTDPTTGVPNKLLFNELANLEIKRARRYGHPFTLAYIDIDDFKNINFYGGNKIGNLLLKTMAQAIKNNLRETDIIARLGGDEFGVILPGIGYETAQSVIVRLQNHLQETMIENQWPATFSIGAITFINPPETVDEILEKADYLMYCIKNEGKNKLEHILEV